MWTRVAVNTQEWTSDPVQKKKYNRGRSGKIMIAFMGAFSYGRKTFEREGATK